MQREGHISIDDLYGAIRDKFSSISLATLYKNIHTMINVSLIREVKIPGQKTKYEIEKEAHAHVMCKMCGELKDVPFNPSGLIKETIEVSQYSADEVAIVISGVCPACQKK